MDIQDQVLHIHKCDELKSPTDPESALKRALCRFPWVGEERDNYLFEYNSLFRTVHSSFKVQSSFILLRVFLCLCVCVCMCEKNTARISYEGLAWYARVRNFGLLSG